MKLYRLLSFSFDSACFSFIAPVLFVGCFEPVHGQVLLLLDELDQTFLVSIEGLRGATVDDRVEQFERNGATSGLEPISVAKGCGVALVGLSFIIIIRGVLDAGSVLDEANDDVLCPAVAEVELNCGNPDLERSVTLVKVEVKRPVLTRSDLTFLLDAVECLLRELPLEDGTAVLHDGLV